MEVVQWLYPDCQDVRGTFIAIRDNSYSLLAIVTELAKIISLREILKGSIGYSTLDEAMTARAKRARATEEIEDRLMLAVETKSAKLSQMEQLVNLRGGTHARSRAPNEGARLQLQGQEKISSIDDVHQDQMRRTIRGLPASCHYHHPTCP